jgi:hypothetical protein
LACPKLRVAALEKRTHRVATRVTFSRSGSAIDFQIGQRRIQKPMAMLGVKIEDCQGQTLQANRFLHWRERKISPPRVPETWVRQRASDQTAGPPSFAPPIPRGAILPHIPLYNPNMSRSIRPTAGGCLARPIPLLPFHLFLKVSL